MSEDRMSAHRFRWLGGLLIVMIVLLLWQNLMLRTELRRLHNYVEEAVATAEDACEYARIAKENREPGQAEPETVDRRRIDISKYKRGFIPLGEGVSLPR